MEEQQPTFRTGLGKSVEVKQSSIARARSVLGEVDCAFIDSGIDFLLDMYFIFQNREICCLFSE